MQRPPFLRTGGKLRSEVDFGSCRVPTGKISGYSQCITGPNGLTVAPSNRSTQKECSVQQYRSSSQSAEEEDAGEGTFREMKLRGHYEKPSERRVREKTEAIRRARKLARIKLQREGLLPVKPRVIPGTVGRGGPARTPPF
jgi:small subunit ribosomal protein S21